MTGAEWLDPLLRGLGALVVAAILFGAARWRFSREGDVGASTDMGLD